MLSSRPSAMGNTMPGNSTRLRVATMGTASAGRGGSSIRGFSAGFVSISSIVLLAYSIGTGPDEPYLEATIHVIRFTHLHASRQRNASHEMPVGNLQPANDRIAGTDRQRAPRTHSHR